MYAQTNYAQKFGTGIYTIAEAGCFLTAFANLLERFGETIDPVALNQYFLEHNSYTHDNSEPAGTVDNLGWGSVSAYDSQIITVGIGGAGWPDSNDSIVKFIYKSPRTGNQITHFCLVQDANNGIIIDSWDGIVKHSPYGAPVASAKYERHQPQVVTPPPAPEAQIFTIETISDRIEKLNIDTHLWDLNQRSWPGLVNNPISKVLAGTTFTTSRIAHHVLGGSYYIPDNEEAVGYNTVDCIEVTPSPAPVEAPAPPSVPKAFDTNIVDGITFTALPGDPKKMYISRVGGAEKWSFKNVTNWRGFKSVEHVDYGSEVFIVGTAKHPIPPTGAMYYMVDADFGDFKKTGNVTNQYGFNRVDLSDTKPVVVAPAPVVVPETTTPVVVPVTQVEPTPTASTFPVPWQETYRPFPKPIHYIASHNLTVKDLSGQAVDMPLSRYDDNGVHEVGVVSAYGTVTKDGVDYYRLKTNNDPNFAYWYCVPKFDNETRTPNLLVKSVVPMNLPGKVTIARDSLELVKNKFEDGAIQFLDDIIPKWFKNKK